MVAAVSTSTEDRLSGSAPRSFSIIVRSCRCPYDPRATLEKIGRGSTCLTDDTRVGRQLEASSCHSRMTNRRHADPAAELYAWQAIPRKSYQSGPYTPIMGPNGRKLLFRFGTGE